MTGKQSYPVRFTGLRGTVECTGNLKTDDPGLWQRYLRHARSNKDTTVITCLCLAYEELEVRRRLKVHLSRKTDQCWLSSYAFTGHEHAQDCRFFSVWPDERQAAIYTSDVVRLNPDGSFILRLPVGLQKKEGKEVASSLAVAKSHTGKRRRHPEMRLLGLLHFLWERSGINIWRPVYDKKKRDAGWVSWHLQETAKYIHIGRVPLLSSLLLMTGKGTHQADRNWQCIRNAEKSAHRLIAVSVLAAWNEAAEERLLTILPLGLFAGFPELRLPDDVLCRLRRSFARELNCWRQGYKIIVIAETDPPETTFRRINDRNIPLTSCNVIDVALMTVSPRFIPLDSSYEGVVENKLWEQKRAFTKPLRYDGEEEVFPDFLLTDIRGIDALPMEIFGMNTEGYLQRKREKTAHYNREYGENRWWKWDAAEDPDGQNMPAFPESK